MSDIYPTTRIAAVQAAPVFLNREATIEKVAELAKVAKANGADLVVFPEAFVPTFPVWCQILAPMDMNDLQIRLFQNAVHIPSPAFAALQKIARDNHIFMSIGVTEKADNSMGAMWNTNLIFDRDGNMIARHRKLMPTWAEKLIWSFGDGSSLNVHDTEIGRLGCLICGENTNTLAKYAMTSQMEQIHISTYPPTSPSSRTNKGDYYSVIHHRARSHSFESKVYTVTSCSVLDDECIKCLQSIDKTMIDWLEHQSWGVTMIVGPNGQVCSDREITDNKEGIVYADCDINKEIWLKNLHDISGSYQRFDIFRYEINKTALEPVYIRKEDDLPDRDFYPYIGDEEGGEPGAEAEADEAEAPAEG